MNRSRWSPWTERLLVLALPFLLLAVNLRLVTNHRFVGWEYQRPGFPADPYGLSTEERIRLAQVCQDYLASNADISMLAELELPNGEPAFNQRELRHMEDVQAVYLGFSVAGLIAAVVWIGAAAALIVQGKQWPLLPRALRKGSLLTIGLLAAIGAFMLLDWGQFFTAFHRLLFEGDTWIFPPSDTLIRLFPIQFWVDVAAAIVGLLLLESVVAGAAGWIWAREGTGQAGDD